MSITAVSRERQALGFLILLSLLHAVIDVMGGAVVALLPTLREQFTLSYTMVGNIMLFSSLTSSFTQPIFGVISDRSQQRWLLPASLMLGGAGLALIGWMPSYAMILFAVVVSALGTAAFHPEGAHAAHHLSGNRRARAMAIYSVGGNLGFALGPLYAAWLLSVGGGSHGTTWALLLPTLVTIGLVRLLPRWQALEQHSSPSHSVRLQDRPSANWTGAVLLTLLVILRSVIHMGVISYIPFYWIDVLGMGRETAGYVQVTYMMAGVVGTLFGSPWADWLGNKRLLILSFVLLLPFQVAVPFLSGWALLVVLFVAGFLVVTTFAVTLVMTQDYMPRALGLASGINLGLAFGMAGVGTLLLGMISDRWGVVAALHSVTALVPVTLLLALILPPAQRSASAKARLQA